MDIFVDHDVFEEDGHWQKFLATDRRNGYPRRVWLWEYVDVGVVMEQPDGLWAWWTKSGKGLELDRWHAMRAAEASVVSS